MSGLDPNALDRWITGGRYSKDFLVVTCSKCEEDTPVVAETEYGATYWSPEECKHCGETFTGEEPWELDGPDEDLAYERWMEERDA